jgi:hypothetical protein
MLPQANKRSEWRRIHPVPVRSIERSAPYAAEALASFDVSNTGVLERHRAALARPPYSPAEYRAAFIAAGLKRSAERLFS